MKTIKFVNKDKGLFTATLRKNVNDYFQKNKLSQKGNWKMLLKALAMLVLYFGPFIILLMLPISGWLIFPISIVMGIGMSGIGMSVMHDAVHGSFSNFAWLNKLFGASMYFIGGNTFNWKVQHNLLHHTYTNIEGYDEDIDPKGVLRLSEKSELKKVHRYQHIYAFFLYCLMTLSRTVNEFKQLYRYNKKGFTRQQGSTPKKEMTKLVITKIAYLGVFLILPMLIAPASWWVILLWFVTMHLTAGLFMTTVFQMAHLVEEAEQPTPNDVGVIENEWTIHELETTANFARKSRIFGWMIGGLNYQVEHHLFPYISHIHYRNISPIVKQTALEFGVRYNENKTFFGAIGSHIRMLKKLGRQKV
ncbi:MAG TPA: fatty acid desaturase [Bacteroidia bacterium]|jgi:linoleoyl-CoA desaturase|nr:fatty acid desaturase [Bacteroidia bacterium]